jgi:phage tail sheath protein FI
MAYKYGTYAKKGKTQATTGRASGTNVVALGTAPIHLVRGYATAGLVNKPIKLTPNAGKTKIGYSKDWAHWSLSEVLAAFFDNPKGNLFPLYVINIFDPETNKAATPISRTLTFVNGRCEFESDVIILDSFAIAEKAEGVDYSLDYDYSTGKVIIDSNDFATKLDGSIAVTYDTVEYGYMATASSAEKAAALIGGVTAAGVRTGLGALPLLYMNEFQIANIVIAPGFSQIPSVYPAAVNAVQNMNGHWWGMFFADIPTDDVSGIDSAITTRAAAIAWKATNARKSEHGCSCWPKAIDDTTGNVYHLSTLKAVEQARIDADHNGIPQETSGNKSLEIVTRPYVSSTVALAGFEQGEANELTAAGITTVLPWEGNLNLWGHHTDAYLYGGVYDARTIFDVSVRMISHIMNRFQKTWQPKIDNGMTLQLKQYILDDEQKYLDQLVAVGALIGKPVIEFVAEENAESDILEGAFTWNFGVTPTPPFASGTAVVAYTSKGFSAYLADE